MRWRLAALGALAFVLGDHRASAGVARVWTVYLPEVERGDGPYIPPPTATFTPSPTPTVALTSTPTPTATATPSPTATATPIFTCGPWYEIVLSVGAYGYNYIYQYLYYGDWVNYEFWIYGTDPYTTFWISDSYGYTDWNAGTVGNYYAGTFYPPWVASQYYYYNFSNPDLLYGETINFWYQNCNPGSASAGHPTAIRGKDGLVITPVARRETKP
jgi:hypothetical protein